MMVDFLKQKTTKGTGPYKAQLKRRVYTAVASTHQVHVMVLVTRRSGRPQAAHGHVLKWWPSNHRVSGTRKRPKQQEDKKSTKR